MTETPVFGSAAVATPHGLAGATGQRILAAGGNAVEAMVAMAATIAVVYPHMNGIGGDGFWLVADKGRRVRAIEACGSAGSVATRSFYRDKGHDRIPVHGAEAALTVPGTIGGWAVALEAAHSLGGRLPLDMLMEDAIRLARDGVPVSPSQARVAPAEMAELAAVPGFAAHFTVDGKALPAGHAMLQPALAATLEQLVHAGLGDFYRGDIARELAADLERAGAPVTREDLRRYEARVREPLSLPIDGARLYNTAPPTQGLASLIGIGLFERLGVSKPEGFDHLHGLIEALKRAVRVRDRVVADPVSMTEDPEAYLASAFLDREAASISMRNAGQAPPLTTAGDTVWMGAIDRDGLAVSFIQSVYWDFGSGLVLPRTGVLMHNRGVSFSLDPASLNRLEPGRKPFHTLNPAMALFDDGRVMPFGTMGGDAQPQIQAQLFSRYRLGMGLGDAVDAPRFVLGARWGEAEPVLHLENRFDEALVRALERAGHPVVVADTPYGDLFGHAGALIRHRRDGRIEAVHDPRADAGATGL